MTGTQEKLELLKKIARRFNESQIEWALGASLMLFLKGIVSEFHDIDLMISVQDVERAKAILLEMGDLCPPNPEPNPMYQTKVFMEFIIDSIDVDVMAGFAIVKEGKLFDCSLHADQIVEKMALGTEIVTLQSLLLWSKYYRLMERPEKAEMIEKAIEKQRYRSPLLCKRIC